jgi:hypothetical protein
VELKIKANSVQLKMELGLNVAKSELILRLALQSPGSKLGQGLYSCQIEIWTATKMAQNRDKTGQFEKFLAKAARTK